MSPRTAEASEPAVLCAGTVNADFVLAIDAPLERGASLIARRALRTSGGRAGNVAVMARRLGTRARLFGCVGTDVLADQALAGPGAAGVELDSIRRVATDTGVATILVSERGGKTMVLAAGANDAFSDADGERLAGELRDAAEGSVLVVDNEVSPAAIGGALEQARASGRPSVLDPTRPERATDRLLALSDHVVPNADEAGRMTGIAVESPADARHAARRLRERGARHVHVRLRDGGCLTLWAEGELLLRAPAGVDVVDTTGAGDAFAGTLAAAILAGQPTAEAARLAVAAASCAVTGFGAQESYPDRAALEELARGVRVV
ncbi:MAG: sugar kinase [Conexibacter sp.]|nr:sugar kinase [Conexibacter sp.]